MADLTRTSKVIDLVVNRKPMCDFLLVEPVLKKCNVPESQLEALAEDRVLWSLTCATGLKNLAVAAEQAACDRRARRHAAATATPAGPACPRCGRICGSDFGLRSHLRVHE